MILIPILALVLGILIGTFFAGPIEGVQGIYMGVVIIAGLDTIFGGTRSALEGRFRSDLFLTGFTANILFSFFLAWLGDTIGINLVLAAAVFFGMRILNNLSAIRRRMLPSDSSVTMRREELGESPVEEI